MAEPANPLMPDGNPQGCTNPDPDLSAREARRKRFSDMAKAPRRTRGFKKITLPNGTPKWMQTLLDELSRMRRNPLLVNARRDIRAELGEDAAKVPDELIEATARSKVLYDLTDGALFSIHGGPVNRHKRSLHRLTEQRDERLAAYLSMRARIGLDREQIANPTTASEAFRSLILEEQENGPTMAAQMAAARERVATMEAQRQAEMESEIARQVAERLAATGISQPIAALPSPEAPPVEPAPVEPATSYCEVDPEPVPEPEPIVEDLGNQRAPLPSAPQPAPAPPVVREMFRAVPRHLGAEIGGDFCFHPSEIDRFQR